MSHELTQYAQQSISKGSKSFALAAMFFDGQTRQDVWLLYSWCRFVDDIADGELPVFKKKNLLQIIKKNLLNFKNASDDLNQNQNQNQNQQLNKEFDLSKIDDEQVLFHPAQRSFLYLVKKYKMNTQYAIDLIRGMEWDLEFRPIKDQIDLEDYCYCVAGTVGLMMCSIMGVKNTAAYPFAKAMGNAMQITNICRDLLEDRQRGRCYLPVDVVRSNFNLQLGYDEIYQWMMTKMTNEQLYSIAVLELRRADELYEEGQQGIIYLPLRAAWAVLSAKYIYRQIGVKITQLGVAAISIRVFTTKFEKILLIFRALADLLIQFPQRLKKIG